VISVSNCSSHHEVAIVGTRKKSTLRGRCQQLLMMCFTILDGAIWSAPIIGHDMIHKCQEKKSVRAARSASVILAEIVYCCQNINFGASRPVPNISKKKAALRGRCQQLFIMQLTIPEQKRNGALRSAPIISHRMNHNCRKKSAARPAPIFIVDMIFSAPPCQRIFFMT
jgi:hypothetical protein